MIEEDDFAATLEGDESDEEESNQPWGNALPQGLFGDGPVVASNSLPPQAQGFYPSFSGPIPAPAMSPPPGLGGLVLPQPSAVVEEEVIMPQKFGAGRYANVFKMDNRANPKVILHIRLPEATPDQPYQAIEARDTLLDLVHEKVGAPLACGTLIFNRQFNVQLSKVQQGRELLAALDGAEYGTRGRLSVRWPDGQEPAVPSFAAMAARSAELPPPPAPLRAEMVPFCSAFQREGSCLTPNCPLLHVYCPEWTHDFHDYCIYYQTGSCNKDPCHFLHETDPNAGLAMSVLPNQSRWPPQPHCYSVRQFCPEFQMMGMCGKLVDCKYMHRKDPEWVQTDQFYCPTWNARRSCFKGEKCIREHEVDPNFGHFVLCIETPKGCRPLQELQASQETGNKKKSNIDEKSPVSKRDEKSPVSKRDETRPVSKRDEKSPVSKRDETSPVSKRDESRPVSKRDESEGRFVPYCHRFNLIGQCRFECGKLDEVDPDWIDSDIQYCLKDACSGCKYSHEQSPNFGHGRVVTPEEMPKGAKRREKEGKKREEKKWEEKEGKKWEEKRWDKEEEMQEVCEAFANSPKGCVDGSCERMHQDGWPVGVARRVPMNERKGQHWNGYYFESGRLVDGEPVCARNGCECSCRHESASVGRLGVWLSKRRARSLGFISPRKEGARGQSKKKEFSKSR